MKQVILNENKLNGLTVYETAPIGSLIAFLGTSAPAGWLLCNQDYELKQSDYPDLYNMVKDFTACQSETSGYFKIPNLSGLVLQGESGNLGEILSAGLPNITGEYLPRLNATSGGFATQYTTVSGAFKKKEVATAQKQYTTTSSTFDVCDIEFDASKSNEIYGNSDTVQPPAFTVNYILKATNYVSLPTNAIDDTKATTGNCWSASEVNKRLSYSTTETVIGTWIDGKPIYRKVFKQNGATAISTGITNVENVIKLDGTFKGTDGTFFAITGGDSTTSFYGVNVYYNSNTNTIGIAQRNRTVSFITIILEYTKSTD